LASLFHRKGRAALCNFDHNMSLATFCAIFSRTHLVTLLNKKNLYKTINYTVPPYVACTRGTKKSIFYKISPYTLPGFDLTTHSSNVIGGDDTTRPCRQGKSRKLIGLTVPFSYYYTLAQKTPSLFPRYFYCLHLKALLRRRGFVPNRYYVTELEACTNCTYQQLLILLMAFGIRTLEV
jgi:hypothetical protein